MKTQNVDGQYNFKFNRELILLVGNIASGKSTYVEKLAPTHAVLSRDKIRYSIGNGNYVCLQVAISLNSYYHSLFFLSNK